ADYFQKSDEFRLWLKNEKGKHFDGLSGERARSGSRRVKGPTLPSASDLTLGREMNAEQQLDMRAHKRKREKAEGKERVEDAVGPKEVRREENGRPFREGGDDGLELDESTLLGGGDSFKDQIGERDAATRERANAFKEKEKATMVMFQQLAKQRFG
ncbi:hypothetical protein K443DRAFT_684784, partial [Laccaria amethystina LaAM-08-1]